MPLPSRQSNCHTDQSGSQLTLSHLRQVSSHILMRRQVHELSYWKKSTAGLFACHNRNRCRTSSEDLFLVSLVEWSVMCKAGSDRYLSLINLLYIYQQDIKYMCVPPLKKFHFLLITSLSRYQKKKKIKHIIKPEIIAIDTKTKYLLTWICTVRL